MDVEDRQALGAFCPSARNEALKGKDWIELLARASVDLGTVTFALLEDWRTYGVGWVPATYSGSRTARTAEGRSAAVRDPEQATGAAGP